MRIYKLTRSQKINGTIDVVWDFFSDPVNLDSLTPPNMGFHVLTPSPIPKMYVDQILEYKVSPILNIPIYWKTKITDVKTKLSFVDQQQKGPYALWLHQHIFEDKGDHVMMTDNLSYALPFGPIGRFSHFLFVKNKLEEIFNYRYKKVDQLFNKK